MTDSLLDALATGLAIGTGLLLVGILRSFTGPTEPVTPWSWRRHVVSALQGMSVAWMALAVWAGASAPARTVSVVLVGLIVAATLWTFGLVLSRGARTAPILPAAPLAARQAPAGYASPTLVVLPSAIAPATAVAEALPLHSSRVAGMLFESSADAIGTPMPSDPAEFDARLMHANRMQSIGRLAGGIVHDFNNLLTSILTSAEMAQEALPAEHGIAPDLMEIRRAGTRASELTRQLLAFARRDVSRPRVVDANALVGNLATMLRRLLGETIVLRISLGNDLPLLHADPAQLEQVIVNLAVNARDAMPGGGELQLRTRRGFPAGRATGSEALSGVVLEVQDSGSGMSHQVRDRLFEPFFTTKNPGRGTGLGLATCHAIVVSHGGEIEVESHPDEGSTFRVWLPPTDENEDARAAIGSIAARTAIGAPQQTILVVEDDADVRASATRALRRAGYQVLEADDGERALEMLVPRETRVDLVVSDVVMPRLGGAAFVRALSIRAPGVPVLFISGYPGDSPDVRAVEAMGIPVLEKPFSPSILLFEVRLRLETTRTT